MEEEDEKCMERGSGINGRNFERISPLELANYFEWVSPLPLAK